MSAAVWERVRHMLIKAFIHVSRDPRMRAVVFVTPVLQVFVLGYAVTMDITHIPTAVMDLDRTPTTRELLRRFERSGYFQIVERVDQARALGDLLDRGRVKATLPLDPGFTTDLERGRTGLLQVLVDGTDSSTAAVVADYAGQEDSAVRLLTSCFLIAALGSAGQAQTRVTTYPMSRDSIVGRLADLNRIHTPEGIEVLEPVEVNGSTQWISIRGLNRANPILLFVHGGPGSAKLGMSWAYQKPWEDFFTVVNWDQRGVGKNAVEGTARFGQDHFDAEVKRFVESLDKAMQG